MTLARIALAFFYSSKRERHTIILPTLLLGALVVAGARFSRSARQSILPFNGALLQIGQQPPSLV